MKRARWILAAGMAWMLAGCASPLPIDPSLSEQQQLYAPHQHEGRYYNPWAPFEPSIWGLFKAFLSPNPYDRSSPPQVPIQALAPSAVQGRVDGLQVSWLGHATSLIQQGDSRVLTDPHLSDSALFYDRDTPPALRADALPPIDLALISHNHYDHLDEDTVRAMPAGQNWVVPLGVKRWFAERGREQVVELDWWQQAEVAGWQVTCVPLQHWSTRWGVGTDETLWCGWLLERGSRRLIFVGDSGYFHGFAEIGRRYGPIDVAILPIGAYSPRGYLGYQHMDPAQAWRATEDLQARYLIPVHWGAFDFSQEPLDEAPKELRRAMAAAGADPKRAVILPIGGQWQLPESPQD